MAAHPMDAAPCFRGRAGSPRPTQRRTTPLSVILRPQAEESVPPVLLPFCYAQGREKRILRFAQNDKGGAQNDGREGGASLRSPPQSGCAGQLPRPGGAMMGAQIRGPTRAQRSGSRGGRTSKGAEREMPASQGDPTRLTSLVGKGRTVERTRPARKGGARDAKLVRT